MVADKESYSQHISHKFNEELNELKNHLMVMGGLVEQQVADAIEALMEGDTEKAMEVRRRDKEVDKLELTIDDEAVHVIARRQPAASDLRLVMSVVKMVADLERIGDEAKKIAKLTIEMGDDVRSNRRSFVEVRNIALHVRSMIRDALDAFTRLDTAQALAVMREDDDVDEEYKSATRALMTHMMEDPRSISGCLNQMWVLRSLERVGDHADNLAEHVIFMVEGTDVRHTSVEEIEKVVGKKR
ncbi:MAG: phosphate signaling complex protein PhoU [Oleiphilaceae bacterium]|nr:phosphate signaling complex protein PhoU [Oleiphilaceae bacterium]